MRSQSQSLLQPYKNQSYVNPEGLNPGLSMAYYKEKQRYLLEKRSKLLGKNFFGNIPHSMPQQQHQHYQQYNHSRTPSNLSSVQISQNLPELQQNKKWGDPKNLEKLMEIRADKIKLYLKKKNNASSKKHKKEPSLPFPEASMTFNHSKSSSILIP